MCYIFYDKFEGTRDARAHFFTRVHAYDRMYNIPTCISCTFVNLVYCKFFKLYC